MSMVHSFRFCFFFFFNDTATTEIYTLSLHDALPICRGRRVAARKADRRRTFRCACGQRSEEHTSELQSHSDLVCRLLLEKKKNNTFSLHAASKLCHVTYAVIHDFTTIAPTTAAVRTS